MTLRNVTRGGERAAKSASLSRFRRGHGSCAAVGVAYRRHEPEKTVLYEIVREHMNTFFDLAEARSREGHGLPRYVKDAFRRYLKCGILAHGFIRVRCPDCGFDRAVAFS